MFAVKKERAAVHIKHIGEPQFECGSVIELPSGPYACVLRKVTGQDAYKVARVDVAKARLIDDSEMELTVKYLASAKLAYSSQMWAEKCIAARLEENKRMAAKQVTYG
jgi:hypothetical protein